MAASVTIPGPSGPVTISNGLGDAGKIAQIIANSIMLASVGAGVNETTATQTGANAWGTPATVSGERNVLFVPSTAGGTLTVGPGYQYIIDESANPLTISGAPTAEIVVTNPSVGGVYSVTGTVPGAGSIEAAGGNNTVSATGTYYVGVGGNGDNSLTGTGQGTVAGSSGSNVITVIDTAPGGTLVLSNGTDSVLAGGDHVTIDGSGTAATLDGGSVNQLWVQVTGSTDTIVASANVTDASVGGTGNLLFGSVFTNTGGTVTAQLSGSADTLAAFGAPAVSVAAWGSHDWIYGTSNNAGTTSVTLSGGADPAQGVSTVVGGAGTTQVLLGSVAAAVAGTLQQSAHNLVLGGTGKLVATDEGFADTIAGLGASQVSVQALGQSALVFGGVNASSPFYVTVGGGGNAANDTFDTIAAEAGPASIVAAGDNDLILGGSNSFNVTQAGGGGNTVAAFGASSATINLLSSDNTGDIVFGGSSAISVNAAVANNTIIGGAGATSVTLGSQGISATKQLVMDASTVPGSGGALTVIDGGRLDTIAAFGATKASVTLGGTLNLLFGGSGPMTASIGGGNDTVIGGTGALTVTAGDASSGLMVYAGSGNLDFVGGAAASTIFGGAGAATIAGGSGGTTLFGASGGNFTFSDAGSGTVGSLFFQAAGGNETLNAGGSTTSDLFNAGAGADTIIGGTGDNTFVAGAGADSLVSSTIAGSHNWFLFLQQNGSASANQTVSGFTGQDTVFLANYGNTAAADVFNAYGGNGTTGYTTVTGAVGTNTTFHMSDGTKITFTDTTLAQLQSHVIST